MAADDRRGSLSPMFTTRPSLRICRRRIGRPARGRRRAGRRAPAAGDQPRGLHRRPMAGRPRHRSIRAQVSGLSAARPAQSTDRTNHSLADFSTQIRTVRSRASEWNINPAAVGVMGFSGGRTDGRPRCDETRRRSIRRNRPDRPPRIASRPFRLLIYPGRSNLILPEKGATAGFPGLQRTTTGRIFPPAWPKSTCGFTKRAYRPSCTSSTPAATASASGRLRPQNPSTNGRRDSQSGLPSAASLRANTARQIKRE